MKIRKFFALFASALLLMTMLTACGAAESSKDYYASNGVVSDGIYESGGDYDAPMDMEAVSPEMPGTSDKSESASVQQKLIKTVDMSAETENLTQVLESVTAQVSELGGYVEQRSVYHGSAYSGGRTRNASLTIRIPAEKLDGFVAKVQGVSNVTSVDERVEDVTLTYVAVQSRINALETEHARLLELMAQAENISDLLEVEARLTQVVGELESVTSQLRVLQNQVDYATVELYIREVQVLSVVNEETVWQRITRGFGQNLKGLGNGIVEFFIFLIVSLPYLVPLTGVAILLVMLFRRRKAKKKVLKNPPFATDAPENKE